MSRTKTTSPMRSVHLNLRRLWDAQHRRQQRRRGRELARMVTTGRLDIDRVSWPGRCERGDHYW